MASKSKSKSKKKKAPSVPSAQMIDVGNLKQVDMKYEPLTGEAIADAWANMMREQQEWFPQMLQNQITAQSDLFRNMSALQREQAPQFASTAYNMMQQYMPNFQGTYEQLGTNLRNQLAQGVPAEFMQAYQGLGKRVNEGLTAGYELGPDLSGEIEQGIRGAQAARGNYLGPAVTADEAFGKGSAAVNLYNQRLGAAQNYLAGKNPTDVNAQLAGQMQNYLAGNNPANVMGGLAGAFMGQTYYPQSTYLDSGLGMQAASIEQQGTSSYNSTLNSALQDYNRNYISAFSANNSAQYENYDRNFEQYLYKQAVEHGLYSTPQLGAGAAGGGMGIMGGLGMGAGALGGIASGVAASGAVGTGATAGIVGGIGAALAAL